MENDRRDRYVAAMLTSRAAARQIARTRGVSFADIHTPLFHLAEETQMDECALTVIGATVVDLALATATSANALMWNVVRWCRPLGPLALPETRDPNPETR